MTAEQSSMLRRSLPEHWVRKIFSELQGNYGSRFLDMWRSGVQAPDGSDAGLQNAMALWGEKLAGFQDQADKIRKALAALPPHPPTLPEFLALCRQQYSEGLKALPLKSAPMPAEVVGKMRSAVEKMGGEANSDWALKVLDRIASGERTPIAIETMALEALRNHNRMGQISEAYKARSKVFATFAEAA